MEIGAPGTIRTSDPQIRSLMLYPAELRARTCLGPEKGLGEGAEPNRKIGAAQRGRRGFFRLPIFPGSGGRCGHCGGMLKRLSPLAAVLLIAACSTPPRG